MVEQVRARCDHQLPEVCGVNDADARRLGRWCGEHNKRHRRIPIGDSGAAITGCPDCVSAPDFAQAFDDFVLAVMNHEREKNGRTGTAGGSETGEA